MTETTQQLLEALRIIRQLCDAPHWNTARKHNIRDIADKAIYRVETRIKKID